MSGEIRREDYRGWDSFRLTAGDLMLVVTVGVGPRILQFRRSGGGGNVLVEMPEHRGAPADQEWRMYGGHRLWHAPESVPRTYQPDNQPVEVVSEEGLVHLRAEPEALTGIGKELLVSLEETGARVVHRLTNHGLWPVELAPWALTAMASGGTALLPLGPVGPHGPSSLLPTGSLAFWSYTDLGDPRFAFEPGLVRLRQDPSATTPQKIGIRSFDGWLGYLRGPDLFVKTFAPDRAARHPDLGSTVEVYTDGRILELETLGPLAVLEPGATVEHVERWRLGPAPEGDLRQAVATFAEG